MHEFDVNARKDDLRNQILIAFPKLCENDYESSFSSIKLEIRTINFRIVSQNRRIIRNPKYE